MKIKDRLNSENKAIWDTIQYRYRNYLETQTKARGDMPDEALNDYIKPYIIKIANKTKPLKKTRSLKRNMTT